MIMEKKAAKVETEVHGAVIKQNIAETGKWIFNQTV